MDTDVELVAPLDRFMNQAAFAGFEDASHVATCVMACEPEFPLFKEFLLQYSNMQFLNPDGTLNTTTNVSRLTDICLERAIAIARYRGWSSLAETFSDFCRKQRKHE